MIVSCTHPLPQLKDPTDGSVNYVDRDTAIDNGYIDTINNQVYLGVDHTNIVDENGRDSVRICSNAFYNYGLVVLDVSHMPGGICGTWQVLPRTIALIEGINDNANNALTLHTSEGCSIMNDDDFTGTLNTSDCENHAPGQPDFAGCDIQDQDTLSYGKGFNANGGGVIAMEWTSSVIQIWFFPNGTTPSDLEAGNPNPASWQKPVAQFQGSCDISSHFQDMKIVRLSPLLSLSLSLCAIEHPVPLVHIYFFFSHSPSLSTYPPRPLTKESPRSSTPTFAEHGPEIRGIAAPTAPLSPPRVTTTYGTTPPRSKTLIGSSTV